MKKRNLAAVVALGYLTFGIYSLYWLYSTRKALVAQNGNPKSIPPFSLLLIGIIGLTCGAIMPLVAAALGSDGIANVTSPSAPLIYSVAVLVGVAAFVAGIPLSIWWFWRFCAVLHQVIKKTNPHTIFFIGLLLYLLNLLPVWTLIAQNDINLAIAEGSLPVVAGETLPAETTSWPPKTPPAATPEA